MCGIVFLISQRPIEADILTAMRDTLTHRGPDGFGQNIEATQSGYWMGIAHRRLSILDLSDHGKQPMESDDGSLMITFNGEIYNYKALKQELQSLGYTFRTGTDTEVLLKAYQAWGADCVKKLNGMFVFVIWDRRTQKAFIARDRFGEKPLYYASIPSGGIIFASEIKAILAHPEISFKPSSEKIEAYVNSDASLYRTDLTFYEGVKTFRPATYQYLNGIGNFEDSPIFYWQPNQDCSLSPSRNPKDIFAEFKHLLTNSVRDRLHADVTVGACLSGGLDSSSICSLAPGIIGPDCANDFITYSARFDDDKTISEGDYIDVVLNRHKLKNLSISPQGADFLEKLNKLYWHQEEPFLSASIFLEYQLYEKIQSNQTKVILDGQGSDEILAGYQYYFKDFQKDCLATQRYWPLIKNTFLFNKRLQKAAKKYEEVTRRFNPYIAFSTYQSLKMALSSAMQFSKDAMAKNILKAKIRDGIIYEMLPSQLHCADRNSMAFSVETRFPFLDYNLVDFCLALDSTYLFQDGWTKYILRKSMDNILPKEVQWRPDKVGFAAPQDIWLRGHLKDWSYDKLFNGTLTMIPQWDPNKLKNIWDDHQTGKLDTSWELWRWISLSQWLAVNNNRDVSV